MRRLAVVIGSLLALCATPAGAPALPDDAAPADSVVVNAIVWTGDRSNPSAEAFAVRGGRFVLVGSNAEARALIGPDTVVHDVQGRRVIPGLTDAHIHLGNGAEYLGSLSLRDASSRDEFLARIRAHAETLRPDEWVVGGRWSSESWPDARHPTPDELDEATGGRRGVFVRMDGHMLIANRAALDAAGVTREGPADPPGGRIGRLPDGEPTGAIYEEAMALVRGLVPQRDDESLRTLMRRAQRELHRHGVTQVGAIETRRVLQRVLAPMDEAGELALRVRASVWEPLESPEEWRSLLRWADANRDISPNVRVLGFKGYMDGSLGARTAWQFEPYLDDPHDHANTGMPLSLAESGALRDLIHFGASLGLQPIVHAIGERANATILDWYEQLPAPTRARTRPRVEHAQHVRAEDLIRFAPLRVIPSMQPLHKADDGRYAAQRLGHERLETSYAFRTLIDSGATLAFGSDWPVVSCDPFLGMHAAVTSRTLEGAIFVPDQAVSIEEALRAYTVGASFALHNENHTGVIAAGAHADYVVLDRDVLRIVPDDIRSVRVLQTVVGGKTVYEAD